MTLNQLYALIESNLTRVGNNRVTAPEIKQVANEIVNFFSSTNPDAFPDWIAAGNYNTNGTGNGRYSKHPDTNGRKRIFETKTSSNVNNAPPTDPAVTENTHWREISQAASAALPEWAPGVFAAGLQLVFHNHSTEGRGLYVLLEPTRPFTSANIETEIVAGQWQRFPAAWSLATGGVLSGPNTIIMGSNPIVFTGNRVSFTPNLSTAGVNVGEFAGTPLSLLTGDLWVQNDGSANRFMGRINGDTRAFLTMQVGDLSNSLFRIPYLVNINTARMNTSEDLKFDGFTLILGGGTATASTILDVKSTTRAVAFPRMTTAQRDAIPNPSASMLIYNTSTNVYNFHNGTVWGPI